MRNTESRLLYEVSSCKLLREQLLFFIAYMISSKILKPVIRFFFLLNSMYLICRKRQNDAGILCIFYLVPSKSHRNEYLSLDGQCGKVDIAEVSQLVPACHFLAVLR